MYPKYSPAIFHLADAEFPGQIMPLGVINSRNTGTLCNSEVINEYGVTHTHLIKRVSAQGRHFHPGFGGINGETSVQHTGSPAMVSLKDRHQAEILEGKTEFKSVISVDGLAGWKYALHVLHTLRNFWAIYVKNESKFKENAKYVRLWTQSHALCVLRTELAEQ